MKITHEITLDVSRQGVQASIPITQHDSGIHSLLIHLRNGSKEIKLDDSLTATLYLSNDSYENVTIYTENSAYPNCLECYVTPNMTSETGEYTAQLQIFQGADRLISAPEFLLMVKVDRSANSTVLSSSPFAAVVSARDAAIRAAEQAEGAATEAAYRAVGQTAANALKANTVWYGEGTVIDDIAPLGTVNVTGGGYEDETITSCGRNVLRENKVTFPLNPAPYTIFKGSISGHLYFSFNANLLEGTLNSTIVRIYYTGDWIRPTGGYHPSTDTNTDPKNFANITRDATIQHYFNGTITQIDIYSWSVPPEGSYLDNIQLFVGDRLPDPSTIDSRDFYKFFTGYEPYTKGETHTLKSGSSVEFENIYPKMTLYSDHIGELHNIDYHQDLNVVINKLTNAIIATGGNV